MNPTTWLKNTWYTTPIHCLCKCVCQPPASIVIVVSPSKPGEGVGEAFGPLSASHFLCLCVCLCVCWSRPLSPCTSSSLLCGWKHMLSLSFSVSFSLSNQCLIGLIPKTVDELFLEIPVMKRLFPLPSSVSLTLTLSLSLAHMHKHTHTAVKLIISNCISERTHACHWRHLDSGFKDSGTTLPLNKTRPHTHSTLTK